MPKKESVLEARVRVQFDSFLNSKGAPRDGRALELSLLSLAKRRDCLSIHGLDQQTANWIELARDPEARGLDTAINLAVLFLSQKPSSWEAYVCIDGLVDESIQLPQVHGIELVRLSGDTYSEISDNLAEYDNERSILDTYFKDRVCTRIAFPYHSEDVVGATKRSLEIVEERLNVLLFGLRAITETVMDPDPPRVQSEYVLIRINRRGERWRIRRTAVLGQRGLSDSKVEILNALVAPVLSATSGSKKAKSAEQLPMEDQFADVAFLIGSAESERLRITKFLRYVTALERLLTPERGNARTISHRLSVRCSILYHSRHVPKAMRRPNGMVPIVHPSSIQEIYKLRNMGTHQGFLDVGHEEIERIRAATFGTYMALYSITETLSLETAGDAVSFVDACIDMLKIIGLSESFEKLAPVALRCSKRNFNKEFLDVGLKLLSESGFISIGGSQPKLEKPGKELFNYCSDI